MADQDKDFKRKIKIMKKLQKGEITTLDAYKECLSYGFTGKADVNIVLDRTRKDSKHDLNLSEIRDLLVATISNRQTPKFFEVKNRPFIRHILLLHFEDVENPSKFVEELEVGKVHKLRVTRNVADVTSIPRRLLSVSASDVAELFPRSSEEENQRDGFVLLADYVLTEALMTTWNYPLLQHSSSPSSLPDPTANEVGMEPSDSPSHKRSKLEEFGMRGGRVGTEWLIADERTDQILSMCNCCVALQQQETKLRYLRTVDPASELESMLKSSDKKRFEVVAMDCEMCDTAAGLEVTRLTLLDVNGVVILDTYVKPDDIVTDYRSQWSGITEEVLRDVSVTTRQARLAFLRIVSSDTLLVGHSLDSDLKALQIFHGKCVDTAILFPHAKGFPYRNKLKWLAEKYLKVKIQRGNGGHDSVEDARTALQLAKLKVEKGPRFGVRCEGDDGRFALMSYFHPLQLSSAGSLFVWSGSEPRFNSLTSCVTENVKHELVESADHEAAVRRLEEYFKIRRNSTSADVVDGVRLALCGFSATDVAAGQQIISSLRALAESPDHGVPAGGTLLLITAQGTCLDRAAALQRRKAACEKVQAVSTWTIALEDELKQLLAECNYAPFCLHVI